MHVSRHWISLLSTVAAIAPLPALAQTATAPSSQATAEDSADDTATTRNDIVVTANKREERIQDVALAITAVSGEELNERRLLDVQDLSQRVPGFSFQRGSSQGPGQRIVLRGLNTGSTNATVASVLDDVPLTASAASAAGGDFAADFDPFDLERVEVLKGPQGTLYGATSLGGLVKYVTKAPDTTRFAGGFDVGGSDIAHGDQGAFAKAYVNLPIATDIAALRVSGYYEYQPGWISNRLGNDREINMVRRYGGRASLLIAPTPDLTIRATGMYQNRDARGFDIIEVRGYLDAANRFAPLNGYNKDTYISEPNTAKSKIFALNIDYDFGPARLQSITSYGDLRTNYRFDTPLYQPLSLLFLGRANTTVTSESENRNRKFNQEIRFASDNAAAAEGHGLEWQVGLFYTREKSRSVNNYLSRDSTTLQPVTTPAAIAATPPGDARIFLGDIRTRYQEYAGYLDLIYRFSRSFDIEAGGRVFHNKQSFTQTTGGALFFPPAFTLSGPFGSNETRATFAVAPRFHFTRDVMLYGRVASGYRPGAPNLSVPAASGPLDAPTTQAPPTVGADTTVNYEVGLKGTLLGNAIGFDVAAFYINWSDIQVVQTYRRGLTGYPVTLNAGKAVSQGVEWNINFQPIRQLSLGWLGAYTDSTLSDNVPALNATDGARLPFVPKWQTTFTADLNLPLSDSIRLNIGGSYAYVGNRLTNFGFDPSRNYQPIPGYDVWNAQAGLRFDRFTVQVYGKNLADKRGITNYDAGAVIFGVPFPGTTGIIRPREVGVRLSGSF